MEEQPFSNREITAKFDEIIDIATRIETQTTKTNGRVTKLEELNATRNGVVSVVKWLGLAVFGILVAYLGWLGAEVNGINKTLSAYEITVQ